MTIEPCGEDALCPPVHRCLEGVCAPWPVRGEPCDGECFDGVCRDGTCVLGVAGEACDSASAERQCEGLCVGGVCNAPTTTCG